MANRKSTVVPEGEIQPSGADDRLTSIEVFEQTSLGKAMLEADVMPHLLADRLQVEKPVIYNWMSGKEKVPQRYVITIAHVLDCRPSEVRENWDGTLPDDGGPGWYRGEEFYGRETIVIAGQFMALFEKAVITKKGSTILTFTVPMEAIETVQNFLTPKHSLAGVMLEMGYRTVELPKEEK